MAQFQELIKNFDRIRDYMRQFYVYGFKVRGDFTEKSARTYDNERRRIESWLADYISSDYTSKGKQISISADSRSISSNPLYNAWKSKSFTDKDLLLHFFILHYLAQNRVTEKEPELILTEHGVSASVSRSGMTAGELADRISADFGCSFDGQTVRLKLKEYENLGILSSEKYQKSVYYQLSQPAPFEKPEFKALYERLLMAVSFFSETAPFGFIGNTILEREYRHSSCFCFKHYFMVHTLEDGVLYPILQAIRQGGCLEFENHSQRSGKITFIQGFPLQIFASTKTGRRYACIYAVKERRFLNLRLDCIASVRKLREDLDEAAFFRSLLDKNRALCFGVSFGHKTVRTEEICIKLFVDEEQEEHILERLYREGKGGEILRIRKNEYLYSSVFFDVNEMLSWVKSFTGRIMDIQSSSESSVLKVVSDWKSMYRMYRANEDETENGERSKTEMKHTEGGADRPADTSV
jgi:DNA-binding transcriptional ArsR family regulator